MQQHTEEWRPITGYKGLYDVSSWGRVRSWLACNEHSREPHILAPWTNGRRYPAVHLRKDGNGQVINIHRVVADAFLGQCPPGYIVHHKNENRCDNRVENLEYVSRSVHYGTRHDGPPRNYLRGEKNPNAILTKEKVIEIRQEFTSGKASRHKLAEKHRVSYYAICDILTGKSWKHL